jgi:hypothetical protein
MGTMMVPETSTRRAGLCNSSLEEDGFDLGPLPELGVMAAGRHG